MPQISTFVRVEVDTTNDLRQPQGVAIPPLLRSRSRSCAVQTVGKLYIHRFISGPRRLYGLVRPAPSTTGLQSSIHETAPPLVHLDSLKLPLPTGTMRLTMPFRTGALALLGWALLCEGMPTNAPGTTAWATLPKTLGTDLPSPSTSSDLAFGTLAVSNSSHSGDERASGSIAIA